MASGIGKRFTYSSGLPTKPVGGADGGIGRGHHPQNLMFKLRALRAPMYSAKTGKKCRELCLVPGRIYTFGRSRSSCDIIFLDRRVSRRHCQVYLDPGAKEIYLLEGAAANEDLGFRGQDLSLLHPKLFNNTNNSGKVRQQSGTAIQPSVATKPYLQTGEHQNHEWNEQSLLKKVKRVCNEQSLKKEVRRFGTSMENVAECSGGSDDVLVNSSNPASWNASGGQARNAKFISRKDGNKDRALDYLLGCRSNQPDPRKQDHVVTYMARDSIPCGMAPQRFPNDPRYSRGRPSEGGPLKNRPSLNGLFVNGEKLVNGGCCILNPGSEVSLIACTEEGQPVDPGFGDAVGFVVELVSSQKKHSLFPFSSAEKYMDSNLCIPQSDNSEISRFRKRSLAHRFGNQFGYDRENRSNAQMESCKERTFLQPVSLATSPLFHVQGQNRCIIGNTSTESVHEGRESVVSDGQGANFELKQTSILPKLNQKSHEKTLTERLSSHLQAKGNEILSSFQSNGQVARLRTTVSSISTELHSVVFSKLTNEREKTTSRLSEMRLGASNCRFLSASDCTRKPSTLKMNNTASNSQTALTGVFAGTSGESLGERPQEQQSLKKVSRKEFGAEDLFPRAARSDGGVTEAFLKGDSIKALDSLNQGMRKATEDNSLASPGRWKSYSSIGRITKIPRRSTTEIMGLLRQVAPTSTSVTSLDRGDNILNGLGDNAQLTGQDASKFFSGTIPKYSGSQKTDGKAAIPLERRSLIVPIAGDLSSIPSIEDMNAPKDKYGKCRVGKGEHLDTSEESGRKLMESMPDSFSKEEAPSLNRRFTGSGFLLNKLKDVAHLSEDSVSLQDLLTPADDLLGLFVATFTSDILWFLSSHNLSPDLPVTVACHDHDRCWSTAEESRSSSPFPTWPNVTVVYPPFPDSCCFATEKRQGIGCHHPKIFLLPRQSSIRVIVTSANLTRTQWLHVTNSVWWQDFPRKDLCDYETLFCTSVVDEIGVIPNQTHCDFAVHLSSFVASLVADVPSAAHWAVDLANYDFSSAAASLVTSIPGLHGCPGPPVPRAIWDVLKDDGVVGESGVQQSRKFLAAVNSNVVGVSHMFKDSADPSGRRIRALATVINDTNLCNGAMLIVQLKRVTNIAADPNAVSVIVSSEASQIGTGMLIGTDISQMARETLSSTPSGSVHIGFLPRSLAKWVAPLYDSGMCTFAACVWPAEVLALASGLSKKVVHLVMYVFEGQSFKVLSTTGLSLHHKVALCGLIRNMERPLGMWRLQQVLSKFNWPDSAETNFVFGSSSVGTSLDAAFLASFSHAAGKKALSADSSSESDPEWGNWTAEHEANSPSIGVVFPTIERVRAAKGGPGTHQGILCFAESTWERLKSARLLHDAVPFPVEREGIPMHAKVAQRRFQNSPEEAPYGWIYCGSHNFSPAAWGRPLAKTVHPCTCSKTALGCALFISNYEVGLIFVEPPPGHGPKKLRFRPLNLKPDVEKSTKEMSLKGKRWGLDNFVLPFRVPAPKYEDGDHPATGKAIHSAVVSWRSEQLLLESSSSENGDIEMTSSEADDSMDEMQPSLESEASNIELPANIQMEEEYGETLWSEIDSIMPQ